MVTEQAQKVLHQKYSFDKHTGFVNSVAFSPDGQILASAGNDPQIRLWSVNQGEEVGTFDGHYRFIHSLAFSPDGKILAAAGFDRNIRLYSIPDRKPIHGFAVHDDCISCIVFSHDGKMIASAGADRTIRISSIPNGEPLQVMQGHKASGVTATLGKLLKKDDERCGHSDCVTSIAFSPDDKYIASGCHDKTIKYWAVKTGQIVDTFKGHEHPVESIAFSLDGKTLISGCADSPATMKGVKKNIPTNTKFIGFWSASAGVLVKKIDTQSYDVRSIVYSPDGKMLATGGWDFTNNRNTIRLWDVTSGEMIRPFDGHFATIYSVAFSPDGRLLSSGGDDKSVKIWAIKSV